MKLRNDAPDIDPESEKPGYVYKKGTGKNAVEFGGIEARVQNPKNRLKSQSYRIGDPVLDAEGNQKIGKDGKPMTYKRNRDVIPLTMDGPAGNIREKLAGYAEKEYSLGGNTPKDVQYPDPYLVNADGTSKMRVGPDPNDMVQEKTHRGKPGFAVYGDDKSDTVIVDEKDFAAEVAAQRSANERADASRIAQEKAEKERGALPPIQRDIRKGMDAPKKVVTRIKSEDGESDDPPAPSSGGPSDPKNSAGDKIRQYKK